MNTEKIRTTKPETAPSRKIFLVSIGLFAFLFLLLIYYISMTALSTIRWVDEVNREYRPQAGKETETELLNNSRYVQLQNQIAFTKARLKMAQTDSIGLSLNLPDSTISLEISGVTVTNVKIEKQRISGSIYAVDHAALALMFSQPLRISEMVATIEKEPIIEKIAPRDTTEANQTADIPQALKHDPVFFELTLNNGLKLRVLQSETSDKEERSSRFWFNFRRATHKALGNIKSLIRFEVPEYSPEILIMIPGAKARAIYRAIPEKGLVSVSFVN